MLMLLATCLVTAGNNALTHTPPLTKSRRIILHRVGELTNGIEIKVRQNDNITTIIRAFLIASPTHNEGDLDPSEYFPDVPQDEHYHRLYDEQGIQIRTEDLGWLHDGQRLFVCDPHRLFMWPPYEIGTRIDLQHPPPPPGVSGAIQLEVLSHDPVVFYIRNFLNKAEIDVLIEHNKNRLKRSHVGMDQDVGRYIKGRNSHNTWDHTTDAAKALTQRAFDLARVTYTPHRKDSVQLLRYNVGERYQLHRDFFETNLYQNADPTVLGGTNRFATIFITLKSPTTGGQTVFPNASSRALADFPTDEEWASLPEAARTMRQCAKGAEGLHVKPAPGDAILWYSQLPSGKLDERTLHGGCPVVDGEKWAANVWIFSGTGVLLRKDEDVSQDVQQDVQQDVPQDVQQDEPAQNDKLVEVKLANYLNDNINVYVLHVNGDRDEHELIYRGLPPEYMINDLQVFVGTTVECQDEASGKVVGLFTITQDRNIYELG